MRCVMGTRKVRFGTVAMTWLMCEEGCVCDLVKSTSVALLEWGSRYFVESCGS